MEPGPAPAAARRWLHARRHHYSVVVCGDGVPDRLRNALTRTQPQALTVTVSAGADPSATATGVLSTIGLDGA